MKTSWYWNKKSACLFIGESGRQFPGADEVTSCGHPPISSEIAQAVFMREIVPFTAFLIPPGKISLILNKTLQIAPEGEQLEFLQSLTS